MAFLAKIIYQVTITCGGLNFNFYFDVCTVYDYYGLGRSRENDFYFFTRENLIKTCIFFMEEVVLMVLSSIRVGIEDNVALRSNMWHSKWKSRKVVER